MEAPDQRTVQLMGRLTAVETMLGIMLAQQKPADRRRMLDYGRSLTGELEGMHRRDRAPVEAPGGTEAVLAMFRAAREAIDTLQQITGS